MIRSHAAHAARLTARLAPIFDGAPRQPLALVPTTPASPAPAPAPTPSPRYIPVAEVAKLIRAALKQAFPRTTFRVRSKSYAGGASISVRYVDGPTQPLVEAVAGAFAGARFDGMQDLKVSHTSLLNGEPVRFCADYVFVTRELSRRFVERLAVAVGAFYGVPVPRIVERGGVAYIDQDDPAVYALDKVLGQHYTWQTMIHRAANDRTIIERGTAE